MAQYMIYRAVDNEIEFKGLRGKFFYYAIGAALGIITLSFLLYFLSVPVIIVLLFLVGGLAGTYLGAHYYNQKYGKWGMDKLPIVAIQPKYIYRRTPFYRLIPITKITTKS